VIVTPGSGAGNGTVSYTVQGNTGTARSGSFVVAGQTITVAQEASCGATVAPTSFVIGATGGTDAVTINAPAGCAWSSTPGDSWIVLGSTRSGTGPGRLDFTVQANGSAQRTGSFIAAGQSVTISQLSGCTFDLTDKPAVFDEPGLLSGSMFSGATQGTLTVTTAATCKWTLVADFPAGTAFVTFNGPSATTASGEGSGNVPYQVLNNPGGTRNSTLTLGGDGAVTITVAFLQQASD
jgi:hypothetical protein